METLIRDWGKTEYAAAVKPKLASVRANLAAKEMHTAALLVRRRNIIAGLNHYQLVASRYQDTPYAAEALFRAAEIYRMIGEKDESDAMLAKLREKYPDSKFK
jgi:outer membrane assembly lipoprotein YfiO